MQRTRIASAVLALGLVAALAGVAPAGAVLCTLDNVPAATLLLPYFEVNLDDSFAETTLFSIVNASAGATVANVVLWTDLGVPTLSFNVYLTGYDVQTVNLRDVFVFGRLPRTADAAGDPTDTISPKGQLSQDITFPGCQAVLPPAPLPGSVLGHLAAAHTGGPSVLLKGLCAGVSHGDNVARGYVTVDALNDCALKYPSDPGYFGLHGDASFANVLWGDYFYVDSRLAYARGGNLVRIEADPQAFKAGDATFYETFVDGSAADGREPLPTVWSGRFLTGGSFSAGSELVVWREAQSLPAPFPCGSSSFTGGYPLGTANGLVFDEQEHAEVPSLIPCPPGFNCGPVLPPGPWAASRTQVGGVELPVFYPFGWYIADFRTQPGGVSHGQSWLGANMNARRQISVGLAGTPLDSGCSPVAFEP